MMNSIVTQLQGGENLASKCPICLGTRRLPTNYKQHLIVSLKRRKSSAANAPLLFLLLFPFFCSLDHLSQVFLII